MAVLSVDEQSSREGNQNSQWQRTYKRTWVVETDSQFDGPVTIRASLPVAIGNSYVARNGSGTIVEHDSGSFCQEISVTCTSKDGRQWVATATYGPYNAANFPANPLDHPIKISWGTVKFERAVEYDVNGDAITNSAGDYFDPPITVDDSRTTLKIERNESRFDPATADGYKDAINSDAFFGGAPGTWKVADITADLQYNVDSGTADGFYYQVTYQFEFRAEGWQSQVLDQGLKVLDSGSHLVNAKGSDNGDVMSPILLDGHGKALSTGSTPVFLTFDVYNSMAFAPLRLDPTGAPGQG